MNIKTLNKIAMTMAVAIAATACSGGDKAKEEKKAASVIYHLCGIVEKSRIEHGSLAALAVCQREGIVLVELEQCRVKRPVRAAQVCGLRGAYLKKLSGCVFA